MFFIFVLRYGKFVKDTQKAVQDSLSEATNVAEERLSNIRTVRALGVEENQILQFNAKIDDVFENTMKQIRGSAFTFGAGGCVIHLFMLTVLGKP